MEKKLEEDRNARIGLRLFGIYFVAYVGFVLISAFATDAMEWVPFAGLNLAVIYGFSLIALAILLALIYGWLCRSTSNPAKKQETGK